MRILRLAMPIALLLAAATARAGDVDAPPIPPSCPSVVEMQTSRDSQVTSIWLANGINIQHRHMPGAEAREVIVTVNIWGSELLETEKDRGISHLAAAAMDNWRLSAPTIATQFRPGEIPPRVFAYAMLDAMQIRMSCPPNQLNDGLLIIAELLTAPQIDDNVLSAARKNVHEAIRSSESNERNRFALAIQRLVFPPGEVRLEIPSERRINAISAKDVSGWIQSHIRENGAAITVSVVGEATLEESLPVLDRHLSKVAKRPRPSVAGDRKLRNIPRPLENVTAKRVDQTIGSRSIVVRGFFGPNVDEEKDTGAVRAMAHLLVHNIKGACARPDSGVKDPKIGASVYPVPLVGFSMFLARVEVDPGSEDATAAILDDVFAKLHVSVDQDVIDHAIRANRATMDALISQPMAWSNKLASIVVHGGNPDDFVASFTGEKAKADDVMRVMDRYDVKGSQIRVQLVPPPKDDF